MRITEQQINAIREASTKVFGVGTRIWLFGSRTNDEARGGDIDLLLKPPGTHADSAGNVMKKIQFLGLLEKSIVERKIDVVIETPDDPRPIVRIAQQTGIEL